MSNTIPLPPLAALTAAIAQLDATPAQKAALSEAFAAGRVCVKAISGGFLVGSFTCGNTYVVTDRCSCPCRLPVCKHRLVIEALIAAHARPAGTVLPPVAETLAWAEGLIERPVLLDLPSKRERASVALAAVNEIF
jgi:hypothetical protein